MSVGQKVMEGIIQGNLIKTECAHEPEHGCVTVWSSGAAEQIEAMVAAGQRLASSTGSADGESVETLRSCRDHWKTSFEHERKNVIRLRKLIYEFHSDVPNCPCPDCKLVRSKRNPLKT